ncbi:Zinc finger protein 395, partial [Tyto alba]
QNSVKVMYKCLWPSCGKVLRSIVGIKRHVKTQHLGDSADSDQRKREEDFYYTEVQVKEEPAPEAGHTARPPAPIIIQQALAKPEALLVEQPVLEPALASSALSQSAPSSFWHIQADHAYQITWGWNAATPDPARLHCTLAWARAFDSWETWGPAAVGLYMAEILQRVDKCCGLGFFCFFFSPPFHRKVRGEAKKCRKVYGIEHRDQWCTACRWKKACQRFLD